jgi:hypothetical protein
MKKSVLFVKNQCCSSEKKCCSSTKKGVLVLFRAISAVRVLFKKRTNPAMTRLTDDLVLFVLIFCQLTKIFFTA